jgi:uncharacterized protein (TIGR02301 family)
LPIRLWNDGEARTCGQSHLRPESKTMNRIFRASAALALLLALSGASIAQDDAPAEAPSAGGNAPAAASEPPAPIYEGNLLRLSEILGSLSFLRDLCGAADGAAWRAEMNSLLAAEDPPPQRRTRLIARFNHGFESLNAVYRTCTPSARLAIARYLSEGEALSADVRGRYSQ